MIAAALAVQASLQCLMGGLEVAQFSEDAREDVGVVGCHGRRVYSVCDMIEVNRVKARSEVNQRVSSLSIRLSRCWP